MNLYAYLVRNLQKPRTKIIIISKDPGIAVEKSGFHKAEVTKICEARYFLKHEKALQKIYLGGKK